MACQVPAEAQNHLCNNQVDPEPEAVLGPFVQVQLDNLTLTNSNVGYNYSDARACIKSFQFGRSVSNGCGFKIEIITEEYKVMLQIVSLLNKTKTHAHLDVRANCMFGWIKRDCNNKVSMVTNQDFGGTLKFLVQTIESNFENGVYKINVECCDLFQRINQQTQGLNNFGDDDNKMPLKEALRNIWTTPKFHPHVNEICFKTWDNNEPGCGGPQYSFRNSDGGAEGPYSTWQTKEKNKLSTTRSWIDQVNTENNKGIFQQYDNEDNLTLIFQEDVIDDNPDGCSRKNIGSFVVNGGNCTRVISFSPKINWLTQNTGTGAVDSGASAVDGKRADNPIYANPKWGKIENIGTNQTETISYEQNLYRPKRGQNKATQQASTNHDHATKMYEVAGAIEAELTIQGNPKFSYNYGEGGIVGTYASIVVINPAVIRENDLENGCIWLADSPVNKVLSNSAWLVKGVDHQITDGKYVTTFKLMLPAPNSELASTEPFGGTNDGWKPEGMQNLDLGDQP